MLPQKSLVIDPIKASKEGLELNQNFVFSHLANVHECVVEGGYDFQLSIKFHYEDNKAIADGMLSGKVMLICQRTLEPFEFILNNPLKLGFVTDDRFFKNFPEAYEPYVFKENQINLLELIEEEILLSIPMIPKKLLNDCQTEENTSYCGLFKTSDAKKHNKPNPFAVLKELKFVKKN